MTAAPGYRRELSAIVALLLGVFLLLALLPLDVTGPAGRAAGRVLWTYLGAGAVMIPLLGVGAGLAGLGRFPVRGIGRVALLGGALALLLPYAAALASGIRGASDFPSDYAQWSLRHRLVGILPGLIATGVTSVVGTAGAVIFGALALSGATLVSIGWHPFRRIVGTGERSEEARSGVAQRALEAGSERGGEAPLDLDAGVVEVGEPEGGEGRRGAVGRRARGKKAGGAASATPSAGASPAAPMDALPPLELLAGPKHDATDAGEAELDQLGEVLIRTLATFRVEGKIVGRTTGPVVTQFEVAPAPGVKVGRIAALADDLALAMRAQSIRIVAPIPGKAAVGVEVPNPHARIVTLRELLETPEWERSRAVLPIALGRNLEGRPVIADLAKMPHLLIAGATGSGKSVCINAIITGLIYRYAPRDLRMIMIDPKMVELSMYNALPHLRHPVVTDNKQAAQALKWVMLEMEYRYALFHANGVRNVGDFNRKAAEGKELVDVGRRPAGSEAAASSPPRYDGGPLPLIVVIVDELADLMMTVQGEVEKPLAILAQKARATGIHLLLATQRPSVNVITGLIKANFPCRIAFRVASKVDSRTILDQNGAETLLGNGDMLFLPPGKSEPIRVQGAYIGTEETEAITHWYRAAGLALAPEGGEENILDVVAAYEAEETEAVAEGAGGAQERDPLFREAAEICIAHQQGSTSLLQRKLRIGYGRAARIIDQLHEAGILGPQDGSKAREVLIGMAQLDEYC